MTVAGRPDVLEARLDAIMLCLDQLGEEARNIMSMKYVQRLSARDIAASTRRKVAAINSLLQRLRARVIECVDQRLAEASR